MTTVLCDVREGLMIVDSCQSLGNRRLFGTKAKYTEYGIAAWSGRHDSALQWLDWIERGATPEKRPGNLPELSALLLRTNGILEYFQELCIADVIEVPLFALGSGSDYALAARYLGHSMEEAMQVTAHFDLYTGPPFLLYDLKAHVPIVFRE